MTRSILIALLAPALLIGCAQTTKVAESDPVQEAKASAESDATKATGQAADAVAQEAEDAALDSIPCDMLYTRLGLEAPAGADVVTIKGTPSLSTYKQGQRDADGANYTHTFTVTESMQTVAMTMPADLTKSSANALSHPNANKMETGSETPDDFAGQPFLVYLVPGEDTTEEAPTYTLGHVVALVDNEEAKLYHKAISEGQCVTYEP